MPGLDHHHTEMARAAAAAMQQHYQEAIDIVSELLTSGTYDEVATASADQARSARAEARLMLATAMHYADGHYEDIVRQLALAMESPPHIQKDACFTLAVVELSFGHKEPARAAMQQCLDLIAQLKQSPLPYPDDTILRQEEEAQQFLADLGRPV